MMKASIKLKLILLVTIAIVIPLLTMGFSHIPTTGVFNTINDTLSDPVQADPDNGNSSVAINNYKVESNSSEKALALKSFVDSVIDGEEGTIRGIYVEDEFGYNVTQQPASNAGYVSTEEDVITEFAMARQYGTIGMLAHNFAAGQSFFDLELNDTIQVVYGDGEIEQYKIMDIQQYQALSPKSATSNFVDLTTGENLTASQLFLRVYSGGEHLTLQTCIEKGSEDSWGRLFLIAEPI